jgi:hypothetical protein
MEVNKMDEKETTSVLDEVAKMQVAEQATGEPVAFNSEIDAILSAHKTVEDKAKALGEILGSEPIRVDGKISPFMRFVRGIFHFFVSNKTPKAETTGTREVIE